MEKLTKKQRGFVKDYIETGNGTQSAMKNYDTESENTAGAIASENLRKPKIAEVIKTLAEQIPNELLIEKHLELLNKEEVLLKNNVSTHEVEVIPTGQIDATAVRAGLDMAYKLKGAYAPDKQININLNQDMTPEAIARATAFDQWFKTQQTSKT